MLCMRQIRLRERQAEGGERSIEKSGCDAK